MTKQFSRRALLGGAISALATAAFADAPLRSLRPVARPAGGAAALALPPVARTSLADLIAEARLGGNVGFVVADARTGRIIEQGDAMLPLPPASSTKAITALYALNALGAEHRFETRVIATGGVQGGIVQGDLVLAGGGDPVLGTDDLASLAAGLKAAGVIEVRGRFLVYGGALPFQRQIDPEQLDHAGYNPAISGLNLNFNRVHFEWARQSEGYRVTMDARSERYRPEVTTARMQVVNRSLPVYTYADAGAADDWTVAQAALGSGGSRWLPVRKPALYAGDVFRTLARSQGIVLDAPQEVLSLPGGTVLAQHRSDSLTGLLRDMLRFSTNITAEALGLTATAARGAQVQALATSAQAMSDWTRNALGAQGAFVDHSGLGDRARMSAAEMVRALIAAGADGPLRTLMRPVVLTDGDGNTLRNPPGVVVGKTGTLNFVSALAGYIRPASGGDLAFAIFTANMDSRTAAKAADDEVPAGARAWNGRSKRLQNQLLQRWAAIYGS